MKVIITKPNTIMFEAYPTVTQQKIDCLWTHIILDLDNWTFYASSDVGNFSYRWHKNNNETFLEFLSDINKQYLLGKISRRTEFNFQKSKQNILDIILEDDVLDEEEQKEILEEINSKLAYYLDLEDFCEQVNSIEALDYYDLCDVEVRDFPYSAQIFVDIFINHIKPQIKEYIKK